MHHKLHPMNTSPLDGTAVVLHSNDGTINVWRFILGSWVHKSPLFPSMKEPALSMSPTSAFMGWLRIDNDTVPAPVEDNAARRGAIATAFMAGILANPDGYNSNSDAVQGAVKLADMLIAELDKPTGEQAP